MNAADFAYVKNMWKVLFVFKDGHFFPVTVDSNHKPKYFMQSVYLVLCNLNTHVETQSAYIQWQVVNTFPWIKWYTYLTKLKRSLCSVTG